MTRERGLIVLHLVLAGAVIPGMARTARRRLAGAEPCAWITTRDGTGSYPSEPGPEKLPLPYLVPRRPRGGSAV